LPRVIVVVPTLEGGPVLSECLASLSRQTWRDFEVAVVDNSGQGSADRADSAGAPVRIVRNQRNVGFGAAINQAARNATSEFVATLNDDAAAEPGWIEALVTAINVRADAGMCASSVRLAGMGRMDSAGMLLCADGSSKQRGNGDPAARWVEPDEVLLPSGSAALYRRAMLDEIGWFDEHFFLYCEDTDLGLRARWAGWTCLYVPEARVEHRYSHSAGRASPLKAYYVERNRLWVVAKCFPVRMWPAIPFAAIARYWWHAAAVRGGTGAAGEFRNRGGRPLTLVWLVIRSHLALLAALPRLWSERRRIRSTARITAAEFRAQALRWSIAPKEVAAQ
jgi:GT2 family glycosyltransferase